MVSSHDAYSSQSFQNLGRVWKSGGTNNASISIPFNNLAGTVQVDTGRLTLSGGGNSTDGTFAIAAGAVLDPTGGNSPTWQGQMNGTGAGRVILSSGKITGSPGLLLNFTTNLFQWAGGQFGGIVTNLSVVEISGTNASWLTGPNGSSSTFFNAGAVLQSGAGGLVLGSYGAAISVNNLPSGTYQFAADSEIASSREAYSSQAFWNHGTIWKSAGPGTATLSIPIL